MIASRTLPLSINRPCLAATGLSIRAGSRVHTPYKVIGRRGAVHTATGVALPGTMSITPAEVPPAVLPGTTASFPIPPEKLISLAQDVYKQNSGVDNPELLAPDFRFEFPVVSLAKEVRLVWGPMS